MNRPATRLVPTLTEVLDDSHWLATGAPREGATGGAAALLELPDLADPVVDLSDAAVVALQDEPATSSPSEPVEQLHMPATAALLLQHEVCNASLHAVAPVLDESLRSAIDAALVEAGPAIIELLLPRLRQRLMPELEALLGDTVRQVLNER